MKYLLIIALIFSFGFNGYAQNEDKKLSKQERKELRKKEQQENLQKSSDIAESKHFILEAHTLVGRRGQSAPIQPNLNFFATDGENVTIQLAFPAAPWPGYNGLGGLTVDGRVSQYKITKGKKTVSIRIDAMSSIGSYQIFINANYGSTSTMRITGNRGERFEFRGTLLPLEENNVYKGTPLF
ncbi:DUF4251 domain-containing protein [Aureibacter tunicatorum]|uniref:DUF4251 domain-containing protein n=1 Tax=Aureibacter tunicatorum TaxID=866807 RepID=A0AAE3XIX6_9BACT|nr:DUF4251 domain-containing protein [Aureibacter tunicatorum]MDR6237260.1 hypothetical protein [Aureibacter tunicatorum]BDD06252.1 hypothetical protein AUTU_37350 [Aureibacter tunicatorum]